MIASFTRDWRLSNSNAPHKIWTWHQKKSLKSKMQLNIWRRRPSWMKRDSTECRSSDRVNLRCNRKFVEPRFGAVCPNDNLPDWNIFSSLKQVISGALQVSTNLGLSAKPSLLISTAPWQILHQGWTFSEEKNCQLWFELIDVRQLPNASIKVCSKF